MKYYKVGYSMYEDGTWYECTLKGRDEYDARDRLESLVELLGEDPDNIDMFEAEEMV